MHKLINILSFLFILFLSGCAIKKTEIENQFSERFFLEKYTNYIRDIESKKFPKNIEQHYSKRRVDQLKSFTDGEITFQDVTWEILGSYMPINSIKKHFLKMKSEEIICLTVIGASFQLEPMYVNILFVNQAEAEWRIDKIQGAVFTDKVEPELPNSAICPENT